MIVVLLGTFSYGEERTETGLNKEYTFRQDVKEARTLYIPMNEGNVNIRFVEGDEIVVDANVSSNNKSKYSKSLLENFNILMTEYCSCGSSGSKLMIEPYIDNKKVYRANIEKNMWFVMENEFRWNDYCYDRNKTKITMNYDIAIPRNIKNIYLRTKDGQVTIPSQKINDVNVSLYKSTFNCKDINASSMNIEMFDESKMVFNGAVKLDGRFNMDMYNSSYGKLKSIEADSFNIELYSKSKLDLLGEIEVNNSANIDTYNSELILTEESRIKSDNLMIETYDKSKCSLLGIIESSNSKIENFDSHMYLSADAFDSETLKIEAYNKAITDIESRIKATSIKLSSFNSEININSSVLVSDNLIIEAFSGSNMKIHSDFSSVSGGKIELYGPNTEVIIDSQDTVSSKLKREVYSKGYLFIDGEEYK
jgi:hypothetical protein